MAVTKRIITIETRQRTVISRGRRPARRLWCELCGGETEMADPESASALYNVRRREIYRRIENGTVHFIENADGTLLVCCRSLRDEA